MSGSSAIAAILDVKPLVEFAMAITAS